MSACIQKIRCAFAEGYLTRSDTAGQEVQATSKTRVVGSPAVLISALPLLFLAGMAVVALCTCAASSFSGRGHALDPRATGEEEGPKVTELRSVSSIPCISPLTRSQSSMRVSSKFASALHGQHLVLEAKEMIDRVHNARMAMIVNVCPIYSESEQSGTPQQRAQICPKSRGCRFEDIRCSVVGQTFGGLLPSCRCLPPSMVSAAVGNRCSLAP